jgi:acylphosphatase
MKSKHILIKGKVQGVFFRATAQEKAEELGITGWVRNTRDGCVEAVANGNEEALKKFIEWCHIGPSRAKVSGVIVKDSEENNFSEFVQIRG